MKTVFLGGSRHISRLNDDIRRRLDEIVQKKMRVVVGDANGADGAMQRQLAEWRYPSVTVYYVGSHPRNNEGRWPTKQVSTPPKLRGAEFYAIKDRRMTEDAECGFMLWDGKSRGTLANVERLIEENKPVAVYVAPARKVVNVASRDDIGELRSLAAAPSTRRAPRDSKQQELLLGSRTELSRESLFAVSRRDGTGLVGPSIPTYGYPTSAADLFRIVKIIRTGHEGWNSCFTDVHSCNALAKLVEGPVLSLSDLSAAETALQVLMWHDRVDVLIPSFKLVNGDFLGYARCDEPRTALAFELFQPLQPFDQIYAVEEATLEKNQFIKSNLPDSGVLGCSSAEATTHYLDRTPAQALAFRGLPVDFGVPAYYSDPLLEEVDSSRGFFGSFYARMFADWRDAQAGIPLVEFAVPVPPLVAIVLDRAASRNDIPRVIAELRQELAPVRDEMLNFNSIITGAYDQAGVEARCKDIQHSFGAVVRASRARSDTGLLRLLKLYRAVRGPVDSMITLLNPEYQPRDPRVLADRTVTGRTFSRLLATDSMHSLLGNILTATELDALRRSVARST